MQRGLVGSEMCIRDRYEIVRLMSVNEDKKQGMKRFASIPTLERARYGIINKPHASKRTVEAPVQLASPGSYFSKTDISKADHIYVRPMRRYQLLPTKAVSYTHLTLPTILLVQISVVAVSLKKKKKHYHRLILPYQRKLMLSSQNHA
eukprot:TRINITY_DN14690_c0_g1_i4.p3 TRINITY_DN14690_c0_g1~~TRINITY_DN14690_c0_g1_i4.p3  ORF type:complete len:148 (+),score=28.25 TRINITY_DN14690_c0_g1_i4:148-591(+)